MHKVTAFSRYNEPPPDECTHKVNLVKINPGGIRETIARDISFHELYQNHIKEGQMLYLTHTIHKGIAENVARLKVEDTASSAREYALVKAGTHPVRIKEPAHGKEPGALKIIPIQLSSPAEFLSIQLDRIYQFLKAGFPVEVRCRISVPKDKEERVSGRSHDDWHYIHKYFPHLRPDFILKAMPDGTDYAVVPVSNGVHVQWVFMAPGKGARHYQLSKGLFRIKDLVNRSIQNGKQGELPKLVRRKLVQSGNDAYSIRTGMVRHRVEQVHGRFGVESLFSEEVRKEDEAALAEGRNVRNKTVQHWKVIRGDKLGLDVIPVPKAGLKEDRPAFSSSRHFRGKTS